MWQILIGVVGCYAAAVLGIHLAFRRLRRNKGESKHYVLVADNQEREMEWVLRSIQWYGARTGIDVHVTVVDEGSRDDTMRIAGVLARESGGIEVRRKELPEETDIHEESATIRRSALIWERLLKRRRAGKPEAVYPERELAGQRDAYSNKKQDENMRDEFFGRKPGAGTWETWEDEPAHSSKDVRSAADAEVREREARTGADAEVREREARTGEVRGVHWFWLLHPEGTYGMNRTEQHVLIDLRNPGDLDKLP